MDFVGSLKYYCQLIKNLNIDNWTINVEKYTDLWTLSCCMPSVIWRAHWRFTINSFYYLKLTLFCLENICFQRPIFQILHLHCHYYLCPNYTKFANPSFCLSFLAHMESHHHYIDGKRASAIIPKKDLLEFTSWLEGQLLFTLSNS
jgi:hypothetical protein